jgi:hypothetical protein
VTTDEKFERLVPLALMVAVLLVAILSITPWPVGAYEDDAIYTLLARSLASGEGYRMINLPDAPHATHYPPGYPFVLSLLWRIWPEFPDNVVVFKFANAVLLAVGAFGLYWFARARLAWPVLAAAAVAAIGTASITMLQLAGLVLSEPLFVALLFGAMLAVERSVDDDGLWFALTAGVMLGALAMVRTIGAVAIGAAFLILLLRRRPRAALALGLASALFLVPWQLWVSTYQGEVPAILAGKYGAYWPWLVEGYREGGVAFGWRRHVRGSRGRTGCRRWPGDNSPERLVRGRCGAARRVVHRTGQTRSGSRLGPDRLGVGDLSPSWGRPSGDQRRRRRRRCPTLLPTTRVHFD